MSDVPATASPPTYHAENLTSFCDELASRDPDIGKIIEERGYPLLLSRKPGFAAIIRLILEQQVSLLSARSAYLKLLAKVTEITPENVLQLSAEELRQCYFSRQKSEYARSLATAVVSQNLRIKSWDNLPDNEIRNEMIRIKGIGAWTADNYLLLCLRRLDIFPVGDIALINSIRKIKQLPPETGREKILALADAWRPYRSVATILFWHAYIHDRRIKIEDLNY